MKRTVRRPITFAAITVLILIASCPAFGQGPGQLNVGDVLVGTGLVNGSGVYQVWRNPGNGYSTIGNITTSDGSTAGCLPDVSWRIYGTISSPSGGFPERFAIAPNTLTGNHPVATTAAPDTSDSNVGSISFDSFGRSYVGGATDITQYVDTNANQTSPPAEPQTLRSNGSVSIAAPYLDLLDDTDLVFTNGGAQISKLSWSTWPSTSQSTLIDTSTTINGTFLGVKVIPGWATSGGSILVANGKYIDRFDPPFSLASMPAATYNVSGVSNFVIVAIDSNGTSFWAGSSDGSFYKIRISDGKLETPKGGNALNISAGGGGTMNGMCVMGGTGVAQAHAAAQTAQLSSNSNTVKFFIPTLNGNYFKATAVNLNRTITANFYSVDFTPSTNVGGFVQGNGITDPPLSLQCAVDSVDLTQCESTKFELYTTTNPPRATDCTGTTNGAPCDYLDLTMSLLSYNPGPTINPQFYGEMSEPETVWISTFADTKLGGTGSTVHSIEEQTGLADTNCGTPFISPSGSSTTAKAGSNLNFKIQAVLPGGSCKNGPFDTNLGGQNLRLTQVFQPTVNGAPSGSPQQYGIAVTNGSFTIPQTGCTAGLPPAGTPLSSVTLCDGGFNLNSTNDNYILGLSTKGLPPGTWIYTFIDPSGHLAPGSVVVTLK